VDKAQEANGPIHGLFLAAKQAQAIVFNNYNPFSG
jgi:hypothetical protein